MYLIVALSLWYRSVDLDDAKLSSAIVPAFVFGCCVGRVAAVPAQLSRKERFMMMVLPDYTGLLEFGPKKAESSPTSPTISILSSVSWCMLASRRPA